VELLVVALELLLLRHHHYSCSADRALGSPHHPTPRAGEWPHGLKQGSTETATATEGA
jgi:hypothetical protein